MKKIQTLLTSTAVVVAVLIGVQSVQAGGPFRFGVKAGVNINSLEFNEKMFDSSNCTGFTGGVTGQFNLPVLGLGVDASAMYTRRASMYPCAVEGETGVFEDKKIGHDYIEVPINLRWNISLPLVGKIVTPFVATGPDFSFLLSKNLSQENVEMAIKRKTVDVAWNFGAGLRFVDHVELQASYGLGISKAASGDNALYGRDRFWTVTAAYIF